MFETFGSEQRRVRLADHSIVWTLVEEGGRQMVVSGFSRKNRISHFITEQPWVGDMVIEVA
jgi:hypothetical protein